MHACACRRLLVCTGGYLCTHVLSWISRVRGASISRKKAISLSRKAAFFRGRNRGATWARAARTSLPRPPRPLRHRLRVAFEPRGLGADDHAGPRISAAAERRNRKANVAAEMYAATAGSSISGDQSGMRILGFCLWVRFHLHSNPGIFSRPVEPQISTSPSPGRHVLTNLL